MANWYVDNSIGVSGNGQSWATAWKDFNNIVWASVAAGDVVNISGGASGQTYSSSLLVVGASGGVGNPITIQRSTEAGKNGTVTLDGSTSMAFGVGGALIDTNNKTNLVIQNLTVQNTFESCVRITGCPSGAITVQNVATHSGNGILTLNTNGVTAAGSAVLNFASVPAGIAANAAVKDASAAVIPSPTYVLSKTATTVTLGANVTGAGVGNGDQIQFGFNARGFRVDGQTGGAISILNCSYDDPASTVAQTDAFFSVNNTGGTILVEGCNFVVNNSDPSGHSDAIQSVNDVALTIRKNILRHPNGGVNNHGVLVSDVVTGGTVLMYDNLIVMGSIPGSVAGVPEVAVFRQVTTTGFTGIFKAYNNTIFTDSTGYYTGWGGGGTLPAGDEFKNNIIYGSKYSYGAYDMSSGNLTTPANTNYNNAFMANPGNLKASAISSTLGGVRGTTSHTTGKWYFEVQLGAIYAGGSSMIGMANAALNMAVNWLGQTLDGIGYWWSNGGLYLNAGNTQVQTAAPWDVIALAIDLDNKKWWVKNLTQGSGWNNAAIGSQDPANNLGGVSFATINAGPYFVAQTFNSDASYVIKNTGGSAFLGTVPANFSAWGAGDAYNPATVVGGVSLTPPVGRVSAVAKTYAQWQALGYDVNGVSADPKLVNGGTSNSSDYQLQSTSPAINAGLTIGSVPDDFNGVLRPQGSAYDIGAFEAITGLVLTKISSGNLLAVG